MKVLINFLSVIFLTLITAKLSSQQVISSGGSSASGIYIQMTWTIGEPVVETFTGTSAILTQGFLQGNLTVTALKPVEFPLFELSVYPDPVVNQLHVDVTGGDEKNLYFCLYGSDGKLLLQRTSLNQSEIFDMTLFRSGIYFLKVTGDSGKTVQVFKIVKNHQQY